MKDAGSAKTTISANDYETLYSSLNKLIIGQFASIRGSEFIAPGGFQDGSTLVYNVVDTPRVEGNKIPFYHSLITPINSYTLHFHVSTGADYRTDGCIHSGGIPSTGIYTYNLD